MKGCIKVSIVLVLTVILILPLVPDGWAAPAEGKAAADFYKGKTIKWYVPAKAGGGYDRKTRAFAPYIEKYTGARVIVINKPGGGMMLAPVHVYKAVKPDGLSLSSVPTLSAPSGQLVGKPGMENMDVTKFNWLANIASEPSTVFVNSKLPYKSLAELRKAKELKFGLTGPTGTPAHMARLVMQEALGIDVKPILGIESAPGVILAVVRGEYDGSCLPPVRFLKFIQQGTVRPLAAVAKERVEEIPNVPTIYEAVKDMGIGDDAKFWIDRMVAMCELFVTIVTTPGVPKDRVVFLEEAFKKSSQEPKLLEIGKKEKLNFKYVTGDEVAKEIEAFLKLSPARKARYTELMKF